MAASTRILLSSLVAFAMGAPVTCFGGEIAYRLSGYFAPLDRSQAPDYIPSSLIGQRFTIRIAWPESATDYSADQQTGSDRWGSFATTAISVELDVPGFNFSIPPTIARWETRDDTPLDYEQGTPLNWGDELQLKTQTRWSRTLTLGENVPGVFQSQDHEVAFDTDYLLYLRAADYSGGSFSDDSLQTRFDLSTFEDVWFEFREIVPVSGGDLPQQPSSQWQGIVESIVAVPEPASFTMVLLASLCCIGLRDRNRSHPTHPVTQGPVFDRRAREPQGARTAL